VTTSDHKWPRGTTSDHEWPRVTTNDHEWPRVTTNDHEWPRVTTSDHEWPRVTTNDHEWPRVTTSDHEWPRVTTSDHEWPRVTTSDHEWTRVNTSDHECDHEWPRMTTSDHEWPRVISVFKNHKIRIKAILRWLTRVFASYYTFVSRKLLFLDLTRRRNLLDTLTMLSWTLQFATFALKVRYHGDSVLRIIKLKICLFPSVLKIPFGKFFQR
jgi:hypothetical protein